jgi:hypothetical protein
LIAINWRSFPICYYLYQNYYRESTSFASDLEKGKWVGEIVHDLWGIATTSLQVGWPLLITALGLVGVAFFGENDKMKAAGGWMLAFGGLALLVWNLKR